VREVRLRDDTLLVLSRFGEREEASFQHQESADVIAVALHLKGGAAFNLEGAEFTTRPGDIWAGGAPNGSASAFRLPASGFETVALRFFPDMSEQEGASSLKLPRQLRRMAQSADNQVSVANLGVAPQPLTFLARAMLASPYQPGSDMLFLEACSQAFLRALDEEPASSPGSASSLPRAKLEHARELLEERYVAPPTIAGLARATGTNEFTLKRAFKQAYGTTIHAYVRRYRLERAAERLTQGLSVQQAAAAVGYQCPRCFAEAFRRTFGVLPSAITRRHSAIAPADPG